jgi:hypothetical protein
MTAMMRSAVTFRDWTIPESIAVLDRPDYEKVRPSGVKKLTA